MPIGKEWEQGQYLIDYTEALLWSLESRFKNNQENITLLKAFQE